MAIVPLGLADVPAYPFPPQGTLAPIFAGIVTSTFLFGIFCDQVYHYGVRFSKTPNRFDHFTVTIVMAFNIFIGVAQIYYGANMMVTHFGEPAAAFGIINDPYVVSQAGNAVINLFCQIFFARRAFLLWGSNMVIAGVLGFFITVGFGAGLGTAIRLSLGMNSGMNALEVVEHVRIIADINFITSAVIDIMLTSLISWKLFTVKREAARFNEHTDNILHRLLSLTLTTAALTTCTAITLGGLLLSTGTASYAAMALSMILPRLYSISTVYTMNVRNDITATRDASSNPRFGSTRGVSHYGTGTPGSKTSYTSPQGVLVALETVQHVDRDALHSDHSFSKEAEAGFDSSKRV